MNQCLYCNEECEHKFCSDSHKVMWHRKQKKEGATEASSAPSTDAKSAVDGTRSPLTEKKSVVDENSSNQPMKPKPKSKPKSVIAITTSALESDDAPSPLDALRVKTTPPRGVSLIGLPPSVRPPVPIKGGYQLPLLGEGGVNDRLLRARIFRAWALQEKLRHLVIQRHDVEKMLRSWGHGTEKADEVFVEEEDCEEELPG